MFCLSYGGVLELSAILSHLSNDHQSWITKELQAIFPWMERVIHIRHFQDFPPPCCCHTHTTYQYYHLVLASPFPPVMDDVICECLLRGIVAILGDLNLTLIPGGGGDKVSNWNGVWVALGDNNAYDVKGCHCLGIGVGEVNSEFGPCTSCSCPRRQWWRCRDAAPDDAVRVDKLAAGPLLREATDLAEKIWAMTS